jgi:hypothetical protein
MHRKAGVPESLNGAFQVGNTSRNTRDLVYDDSIYLTSVYVIKKTPIS